MQSNPHRILAHATELAGNKEAAIRWFRHRPIAGFNKTAEQLVEEGHAEAVLWALESMEQDSFA